MVNSFQNPLTITHSCVWYTEHPVSGVVDLHVFFSTMWLVVQTLYHNWEKFQLSSPRLLSVSYVFFVLVHYLPSIWNHYFESNVLSSSDFWQYEPFFRIWTISKLCQIHLRLRCAKKIGIMRNGIWNWILLLNSSIQFWILDFSIKIYYYFYKAYW